MLRLWMTVVRPDGREGDQELGLKPHNPAGGSLLGLAPEREPKLQPLVEDGLNNELEAGRGRTRMSRCTRVHDQSRAV